MGLLARCRRREAHGEQEGPGPMGDARRGVMYHDVSGDADKGSSRFRGVAGGHPQPRRRRRRRGEQGPRARHRHRHIGRARQILTWRRARLAPAASSSHGRASGIVAPASRGIPARPRASALPPRAKPERASSAVVPASRVFLALRHREHELEHMPHSNPIGDVQAVTGRSVTVRYTMVWFMS
jgi:hypothetical protein